MTANKKDNPLEKAKSGLPVSKDEQMLEINAASNNYYYTDDQTFDDKMKAWVIEKSLEFLKPGRILDLGYINSIWTKALLSVPGVEAVDIVEAAPGHVEQARADFAGEKRVRIFHTLFEEFTPDHPYDTILMSGVVKYVPDDDALVTRAKSWLAPDGVVIASTPNCRAFHRRLGTYMGLESSPCTHNARDHSVFNVRLYDRYSWRALFVRNGYQVGPVHGIGMKLLSTPQMIHLGTKYDINGILEGLRSMAEEMPDYAWYLLLTAKAGTAD
ncbi:bifunctional 2-polyprenyl-6-hydroxyphenol methylase/3-demethylubiquinol 3-O-methyltransferase UbiG [Roseomonas genomospecies 6]|uniref:Methyltransferase domain-containing protein n=1 Tax=Roseomonas genomospecies 6 TaxID=214106 RepID=A0A9W7NG06_9PROT|nr:class I SAM-dependent methyltransferase [Roseomonas genomospecies 6]KAA0676206.1 methyltransferase domain-containing protein [Roseomonas genomospecies 6]